MKGYIWDIGDGRICYWGTHNEKTIRSGVAQYLEGYVPDQLVTDIVTGKSELHIMKGYRPACDEDDIPDNVSHWSIEQFRSPGDGMVPVALIFCQDYGDLMWRKVSDRQ